LTYWSFEAQTTRAAMLWVEKPYFSHDRGLSKIGLALLAMETRVASYNLAKQ